VTSPGLGYRTKYIRWHEWFCMPSNSDCTTPLVLPPRMSKFYRVTKSELRTPSDHGKRLWYNLGLPYVPANSPLTIGEDLTICEPVIWETRLMLGRKPRLPQPRGLKQSRKSLEVFRWPN
jgi:hypothetical protein